MPSRQAGFNQWFLKEKPRKGGGSLNYAAIKPRDIANGPGVRVSLFCSGCRHHCPGCFQPETWDFAYGEPFTEKTVEKILSLLEPEFIAGLTLLGGEPFEPENQTALLPLLQAVRARLPGKNLWAFSGFTLEALRARGGETGAVTRAMLETLDVLVDGPFVEQKKRLGLRFRGSENQRLIDLKRSAAGAGAGEIVLWDGGEGG